MSGHPFLPLCRRTLRLLHEDVNPLYVGTPISTCYSVSYCYFACWRVNPLSIGTPISTLKKTAEITGKQHVSIPYMSGHPFLRTLCRRQKEPHYCVNPLSIGTPISTKRSATSTSQPSACVNPLSIGTPISTEF